MYMSNTLKESIMNDNVSKYPMFVAKFNEVFEELQYARHVGNVAMVADLNRKLDLLVKSATSVGVTISSINQLFVKKAG